jgi:SAM-dependent methyltransferase
MSQVGATTVDSAGLVGRYLRRIAEGAFQLNQENIRRLVSSRPYERMLDLGCDDGSWTAEVASAARASFVTGIEIVGERARLARDRGVEVVIADLNRRLPLADESFDLVHANQVIEHVGDIDLFLSEVARVLRPAGEVVLSTESASSWHNVAAAAIGWQMFSLTNVSPRAAAIGNPWALHRSTTHELPSWTHKTIFSYRGLLEVVRAYGLVPRQIMGAGYHPLLPRLGRLDRRHAHVLAVKAAKA